MTLPRLAFVAAMAMAMTAAGGCKRPAPAGSGGPPPIPSGAMLVTSAPPIVPPVVQLVAPPGLQAPSSFAELAAKAEGAGLVLEGRDYAHALHTPYWWIKCAVGVTNDENFFARQYHKLLVWEIMKQPKTLQYAGKVLDPLIGKSMVLYFRKPEDLG